jgi:SAM-dependent methyltransferase
VITTWSEGAPGEGMPEEMLVETLELARAHPWWAARARLALTMLRAEGLGPPASIVDVGCGWGVNLQALESAGYRATGLDASRQILELIDRPGRDLVQADLTQRIPQDCGDYAGGLLLDVLEHLNDDRAALRGVAPLIRTGGTLIVSVPALPELFSEFDEVQGHRRRYTPESLRLAFENTGFRLKELHWWGAWMVPLMKLTRKRSRPFGESPKPYAHYLRVPGWPLRWVMNGLYALEGSRPVLTRLRTGTSLLAVAARD